MKIRDGTLRRTLYGSAPLLLWAAHFALMYLLAVVHAGRLAMAVLSLLALGAAGALVWRAARQQQGERPLHELAMAANAVLALIAIVWTCVPLLILL